MLKAISLGLIQRCECQLYMGVHHAQKKICWGKAFQCLIFFGLLLLNNPVYSDRQLTTNLFGSQSLDLININLSNELKVQVGDGTGDFAPPVDVTLNYNPINIDVADFNSDGLNDLVALDSAGNLCLSLNDGANGFLSETILSLGLELTEEVLDFITGDLNGDGHKDLVVSVSGLLNGRVVILHGDGLGGFGPKTEIELGLLTVATTSIDLSDLNTDGMLDIVMKDVLGTVHMILSDGLGSYTLPGSIAGFPLLGKILFSDMNNDNIPDLVVLDELLGLVTIRLGNGDGTFLSGAGVSVGLTPTDMVAVDINLDGSRDLLIVSSGDEEINVLIGDGLGGLLELIGTELEELIGIVPVLDTPLEVITGDFNQDCRVDFGIWSDLTQSYVIQLNQSGPSPDDLIFCSVFETL